MWYLCGQSVIVMGFSLECFSLTLSLSFLHCSILVRSSILVLHILRNLHSATASSVCVLQGAKRWQSEGAKWRLGRTFHPAVCRYHAWSGLDSSSCLVEPLQFVVINLCNVRTCRSAVTVTQTGLLRLSHKTLAIALTAQGRIFEFVLA